MSRPEIIAKLREILLSIPDYDEAHVTLALRALIELLIVIEEDVNEERY